MNLAQMRMRAAFLAAQTGFTDVVLKPNWDELVNDAYVNFAWDTEFNQEEVSLASVTNQAEYLLDTSPAPRYFKYLKDVAYGVNATLWESSEMDESRMDPLWYTRPMGTPTRYLVARPNVLRLVPKPSTTNDLIIVRGLRQPVPLTLDTDLPAFPDQWHEALSLQAAWTYAQSWASGADADRISTYLGQYKGMVTACRDYLGHSRYGTIDRRVRRPQRGRVWMNGFPRYFG